MENIIKQTLPAYTSDFRFIRAEPNKKFILYFPTSNNPAPQSPPPEPQDKKKVTFSED